MGLVVLLVITLIAFVGVCFLSYKLRCESITRHATSADRVAHQIAMDRQAAEGLLNSFQLKRRDTGFFGKWRETSLHGHRVAFQPGSPMSILVGEFDPDEEQLTEVYLSKVSPTRPMPESLGRRLDSQTDVPGQDLADSYFLNASLPDDHALKVAEVRKALLELSPAVLDVMIYETKGVQIDLDPTQATASSLAEDVERAASIVDSLEADQAQPRFRHK
jgi:hypothetical protein